MVFMTDLETQKLLRRAQGYISAVHVRTETQRANGGPGLAASGALGQDVQEQFLHDFPALVRLAAFGAKAGYRTEARELQRTLEPPGIA